MILGILGCRGDHLSLIRRLAVIEMVQIRVSQALEGRCTIAILSGGGRIQAREEVRTGCRSTGYTATLQIVEAVRL